MMIDKWIAFLGLMVWSITSFSQDSTHYQLDTQVITDSLMQQFHTQSTRLSFQKDSIGQFGVNGVSADAVLRQAEGLYVKNYGGHGGIKTLSIRGFAAQQTTLSINGVSYTSPQTSVVNLGFFTLDNVDKIEVELQPNGVKDNPLAGNVNLEIQKQLKYFRWKAAIGSFGERIAGGGCSLGGKKHSLQANIQYLKAKDNYPFEANGEKGNRLNAGFEQRQYQIYYTYQAHQQLEINTFVNGFLSNQGIAAPVVSGFSGNTNDSIRQNDVFGFLQVNYKMKSIERLWLPTKTSFTGGLHRNQMTYHFNNDDQLYDNQELFGQIETTHLLPKQIINSIIQYQNYELEGNNLAINFTPMARVKRQQVNAAVAHKWFIYAGNAKLPAIKLASHFRLNYLAQYGLLPNLGTSLSAVSFSQNQELLLHAHTGYRIPSFNELYYFGYGNANLKPERIVSAELTYLRKFRLGIDFQVKATAFYNQTLNKIIAIPINPATWSTMAIGKAQTRGASFSIEGETPTLSFYGNYTLQYAQDISQTKPSFLPYTPVELLNYGIKGKLKTLNVYVNNHYSGWRFSHLQNNQASFLPAYHLTDVGVNYSISRKKWTYTLDVQCENLLNTKYEVVKSYPMPRRSIRGSLIVVRR